MNEEKNNFTPQKHAQTLGYVLDTVVNHITAFPERVVIFYQLLQTTLGSYSKVSARTVAKLAGSISSMWMALGPLAVMHLSI